MFQGSKLNVRGSLFQVEGTITEKAQRCLSAERAREPKPHHEPKNEGLGGKLNPTPVYRDQSSKMGQNQIGIARQVLQSYTKCVRREKASAGHIHDMLNMTLSTSTLTGDLS